MVGGHAPSRPPRHHLHGAERCTILKNFDEVLALAIGSDPECTDVYVCLDGSTASERARLEGELAAARKRDEADQRLSSGQVNAQPILDALAELEDAARASLHLIRVRRMPGAAWTELTSHHPVRVDVAIDRRFGYNLDAITKAALPLCSVRVDDDGEHEITAEQWGQLFQVLSGSEFSALRDAVFALNEAEPAQRLDVLVKGFGAATRSETK